MKNKLIRRVKLYRNDVLDLSLGLIVNRLYYIVYSEVEILKILKLINLHNDNQVIL